MLRFMNITHIDIYILNEKSELSWKNSFWELDGKTHCIDFVLYIYSKWAVDFLSLMLLMTCETSFQQSITNYPFVFFHSVPIR